MQHQITDYIDYRSLWLCIHQEKLNLEKKTLRASAKEVLLKSCHMNSKNQINTNKYKNSIWKIVTRCPNLNLVSISLNIFVRECETDRIYQVNLF